MEGKWAVVNNDMIVETIPTTHTPNLSTNNTESSLNIILSTNRPTQYGINVIHNITPNITNIVAKCVYAFI